ncbi:MAG: hypothetical protein AAF483_30990 [Planctomycetota bacterium]
MKSHFQLIVLLSGLTTFAYVGCSQPSEGLPTLKKREARAVVFAEDRSLRNQATSGVSTGSGMSWSSGMTFGSGGTYGSGITFGAAEVANSNGFTYGSGVSYGGGITLGSGATAGGGIAFGSGATQGGGLVFGSGTTFSSGVTFSSGGTAGSGVTNAPSNQQMAMKPNKKEPTDRIVIPEARGGRSGALFQLLQSRSQQREAEIDVEMVDFAGLQKIIADKRGKVVVLDVWSTSCLPCMREFPNLVALSRNYDDDVVCISLNVDYIGLPKKPVETYKAKVVEFLRKEKAQIVNLMSTLSDEEMSGKLDFGSIPAILIYDRKGTLTHSLGEHNGGDDGLTYEGDVIPKLDAILQ